MHLCRKRRIRYHETPCVCFNTFALNGEQYLGYFCWRKEHVNYRILFAEFNTKLSSIKLGNCENSRHSRIFTWRLAQRLSQALVSLQRQKYLVSTQFKLTIHQAHNNYQDGKNCPSHSLSDQIQCCSLIWHQIPSTNLQRTWCTSHSRGNKIQDSRSLRCNKYMLRGTPSKGTPIQGWKWNARKGFSVAGERVKGTQTVGGWVTQGRSTKKCALFYAKHLVRLLFDSHKIFRLLCFTSYNSFPASARFYVVLVALLITIQ